MKVDSIPQFSYKVQMEAKSTGSIADYVAEFMGQGVSRGEGIWRVSSHTFRRGNLTVTHNFRGWKKGGWSHTSVIIDGSVVYVENLGRIEEYRAGEWEGKLAGIYMMYYEEVIKPRLRDKH